MAEPAELAYEQLSWVLARCEARASRQGLIGPYADYCRRLGAFDYAYSGPSYASVQTDWDGSVVGGRDEQSFHRAEPLDPTLPWAEMEPLLGYGRFARTLVASHPSTPTEVVREIALEELAAGHPSPRVLANARRLGLRLDDKP